MKSQVRVEILRAANSCLQVVILLKSSDRVLHDVSDAFDGCVSHPSTPPRLQLALRRYVDMRPEREFRCFVLNHVLIGTANLCMPFWWSQPLVLESHENIQLDINTV